jgi:hypothetical protein
VDIVQANFNTFRCFDADGELADTWEELCQQEGVDPVLAESKSFRQYVFGHLSPRRVQRIQHEYITEFINVLGVVKYAGPEAIAFISPAEVILSGRNEDEIRALYKMVAKAEAELFEKYSPLPRRCYSFKLTPFQMTFIEQGQYLKTLLDPETFQVKERRLYGVPGNMYFLQFKPHVLQEELEERDLFFWTEHRLAKWIV